MYCMTLNLSVKVVESRSGSESSHQNAVDPGPAGCGKCGASFPSFHDNQILDQIDCCCCRKSWFILRRCIAGQRLYFIFRWLEITHEHVLSITTRPQSTASLRSYSTVHPMQLLVTFELDTAAMVRMHPLTA
jgi:hypothetical protein